MICHSVMSHLLKLSLIQYSLVTQSDHITLLLYLLQGGPPCFSVSSTTEKWEVDLYEWPNLVLINWIHESFIQLRFAWVFGGFVQMKYKRIRCHNHLLINGNMTHWLMNSCFDGLLSALGLHHLRYSGGQCVLISTRKRTLWVDTWNLTRCVFEG